MTKDEQKENAFGKYADEWLDGAKTTTTLEVQHGFNAGWIAKVNGRRRYFKHRRATEYYIKAVQQFTKTRTNSTEIERSINQ